jgi:hypothetical protein
VIKGGVPEGGTGRALVEPGNAYAIYIRGGRQPAKLRVDLPAGLYWVEWLHPRSGRTEPAVALKHTGGIVTLASPEYIEDLALKIVKAK